MAQSQLTYDSTETLSDVLKAQSNLAQESSCTITQRVESLKTIISGNKQLRHHSHAVGQTIKNVFEDPIQLYLLGQNHAVIVSLHAILERSCIETLPILLASNHEEILSNLLRSQTLKNIYEIFITLEIWPDNAETFIIKLIGLRNGCAHLNYNNLKKKLSSFRKDPEVDTITKVKNIDTAEYIATALDLFIRLRLAYSHKQ